MGGDCNVVLEHRKTAMGYYGIQESTIEVCLEHNDARLGLGQLRVTRSATPYDCSFYLIAMRPCCSDRRFICFYSEEVAMGGYGTANSVR